MIKKTIGGKMSKLKKRKLRKNKKLNGFETKQRETYRKDFYKKEHIKTIIILGSELADGYKSRMHDKGITSDNYGTEVGDNAKDYKSTQLNIECKERWPSGNIKHLFFTNNGKSMSDETALTRFILSSPTPATHYTDDMSGVRGVGKRLEECKGYLPRVFYSGEDGYVRVLEKNPCSDMEGEKNIELEDLTTHHYYETIEFDKISLYKTDIKNQDMFQDGIGVKLEMFLWDDCSIKVEMYKIQQNLWTRYSQVKNLNINFIEGNEITNHKKAYFKILSDTGNPVNNYTDLHKLNKPISVELPDLEKPNSTITVPMELYWGHELSDKYDGDKCRLWKERTLNGIQFKHQHLPDSKTGVPLLNILGEDDTIVWAGARSDFWTEFKETERGLIVFVKPRKSLRKYMATQKSLGFSNEQVTKSITEVVRNTIRNNGIVSPHHNKSKKLEDAEVEQFIERMTGDDNNVRTSFQLLSSIYDADEIDVDDNWQNSIPFDGRQVDLVYESLKFKSSVLWEFQPSNKDSDTRHLDGVMSRINLTCCRDNTEISEFVWVARKFLKRHIKLLKKMLKNLKWENTKFTDVYLVTHKQIQKGFKVKDVIKINIEELLKEKK